MKAHHPLFSDEINNPGIQSLPVQDIIIGGRQHAAGHFIIFNHLKHRPIVDVSNTIFAVLNQCHGLYLHKPEMSFGLATHVLQTNPYRRLFDDLLNK